MSEIKLTVQEWIHFVISFLLMVLVIVLAFIKPEGSIGVAILAYTIHRFDLI